MSRLARLTLVAALLLLSWGTVVAPHVDPPGKPHLHVDHVPAALRLAVFARFGHLFVEPGQPSFASAPAPAAEAARAITLALVLFGLGRLWRPDRLGVANLALGLAAAQARPLAAHGPPKHSSLAA